MTDETGVLWTDRGQLFLAKFRKVKKNLG